jgi:hypothetical protein
MKRISMLAAPAAAAALVVVGLGSGVASAGVRPIKATPVQAVTTLTNRPDSGVQGNNWANDNFTRTAVVSIVGEVAASFCPGTLTGHCYLWNFKLTDSGHFTAIAAQLAPRVGTLDRSITGQFKGGTPDGQFYSSWKTAKASLVPATENGAPSGRQTSTNWAEQFFGASAVFNSAANPGGPDLAGWGWTYTLNFGSNNQCPNDAYRWIDSAANSGGSLNTDGNILTPNTADCT